MVGTFPAIRGQARAINLLSRYLVAGRVPPGLLFFGEEGIGKEKTALALVAAILCRKPGEAGACGICPECLVLDSGTHPNLLRVEPETLSIPIEGIRLLKEELSLKAFSDRPRAVVIVPADRMTVQAANALLKTLEEPPPRTHLLLVAHRLSQLPPTITSRCQKVPFSPLSREDVEEIIRGLPAARGLPPAEIRAAAALSEGSPGRALALLEEGEGDREAWARLFARPDPAGVFAVTEGFRKGSGEGKGQFAAPLSVVRDLALLSSWSDADIMNEDLRDALRAAAARKSPHGWSRAYRDLLALSRLPPQAQKRLALEAFLFSLHGKD